MASSPSSLPASRIQERSLDVLALDVPGPHRRDPDRLPRGADHDGAGGDVRAPLLRPRRPPVPVHPEDRGGGDGAGAGRRAALHLHGRHVRGVGHRLAPVRCHPYVDATHSGRPGRRHGHHVRDLRGDQRRGRRHRDGRGSARDSRHAEVQLLQEPHLRHDLRRRLARHHHSAFGARRRHRPRRQRLGRQHPARHVHPGLHAGDRLHHLHRHSVHASAGIRAAHSASAR